MVVFKYISLVIIMITSSCIGINISKKYGVRLKELKEIQRALHIFEEKIKFTYEPIPDVFEEISDKCMDTISHIFKQASKNMKIMSAGVAWESALDDSNTRLTPDDIDILKGMSKMLGKTDLDGQVSEIRLTEKFIDTKIEEALLEKSKNEKLYRTLGVTAGLTIAIVLI